MSLEVLSSPAILAKRLLPCSLIIDDCIPSTRLGQLYSRRVVNDQLDLVLDTNAGELDIVLGANVEQVDLVVRTNVPKTQL